MLKVTLRGLLSHKVRFIATAVAVLLGVAFLSGTQVLASSVSRSFEDAFASAFRDVDVVVRSTQQISTPVGPDRARVSADLLPSIRGVDGVSAAEGQVQEGIALVGPDGKPIRRENGPPTVALNWPTSPELNPWSVTDGRAPNGDTEVVIDRAMADRVGLSVGDQLTAVPREGPRQFTVVGIARFGDADDFSGLGAALFDTATAQQLVGEPGKFNFISVASDGPSEDVLRARVAAVLPDGNEAVTATAFVQESQEGFLDAIDSVKQALLVFGYVALGVGAFIIYNTFAVIVAQRGRELALLRAVGAGRGQLGVAVLTESIVVGTVASLVGVAAGVALGIGLIRLLLALGFALTSVPVVIEPSTLVGGFVVGVVVTAGSALLPAWRASRVPPIAALRESSVDTAGTSRSRAVIGAAVVALGLLGVVRTLAVNGKVERIGIFAVVVFAGLVVLGPVVAPSFMQTVGQLVARVGFTGALAKENAARNPRRTSSTAAALMIGVGLVTFIAVVAQSIKQSTVDAIDQSLRADFVVTTSGPGGGGLPPSVAEQLAQVPDVGVVTTVRASSAQTYGQGALVLAIDPATFIQVINPGDVTGSIDDLGTKGIAVPATVARERNLHVGDMVPITFLETGGTFLRVVAIYDGIVPAPGDGWVISQDLYREAFAPTEQTDRLVYVQLAKGVSLADGRAAVERVTSAVPTTRVQDLDQFTQSRIDRINSFLVVLYALLALALIIAVIGIVNTLLLSVYERTRELGMLRAVGMSRRQAASSICWESLLIAVFGTVSGLAVGVAFGWALVRSLEDRRVRVFAVPTGQLVVVAVLAALAGLLAALYPAWRAARLDVLDAIATE